MATDTRGDVVFVPQFIPKEQIQELIPHRGKMVLVDRVTAHDVPAQTITAEYDISGQCIFFEPEQDGVPSWASFEMMAQTISVLTSIERKQNGTLQYAKPGVVLSVNAFKAHVPVLANGTTVRMSVSEDYRSEEVSRYNCELHGASPGGALLASATITVMEMQDMNAFFAAGSRAATV